MELHPDIGVYISADPVKLPFASNSFDAVLSLGVLEHVSDPDESLEELRRVLEPGGRLYVYKLPNRYSYLEKLAKLLGLYYHGQFPDDTVYTKRSAAALLEAHGFEVERLRRANLLPLTLQGRLATRAAGPIWAVNRALARVPGLNVLATNVELIATRAVKIALVYDCLYPYTVGGAERWYRNLAERLAASGHEVTYLTLRQWAMDEEPSISGVRVVAVGPALTLYSGGRRRILPPLVFGLGVFVHLLVRGRRYDVVHTASFPYFSLLAAAAARRLNRYRLVVDWIEIWTKDYWRRYLGAIGGRVGWWVQRLCVRHEPPCLRSRRASCTASAGTRLSRRSHGARRPLRRALRYSPGSGFGGACGRLCGPAHPGEAGGGHRPSPRQGPSAGAWASGRALRRRARRTEVLRAIEREGLSDVVDAPGFVGADDVRDALRRALCLVLPSRREGYGLVVVEAAALGTPSVVVDGPDNAATELVEEGVNGIVAPSAEPIDLADAIVRVHEGGASLRRSTASWFERNERRLSLEASVEQVLEAYAE